MKSDRFEENDVQVNPYQRGKQIARERDMLAAFYKAKAERDGLVEAVRALTERLQNGDDLIAAFQQGMEAPAPRRGRSLLYAHEAVEAGGLSGAYDRVYKRSEASRKKMSDSAIARWVQIRAARGESRGKAERVTAAHHKENSATIKAREKTTFDRWGTLSNRKIAEMKAQGMQPGEWKAKTSKSAKSAISHQKQRYLNMSPKQLKEARAKMSARGKRGAEIKKKKAAEAAAKRAERRAPGVALAEERRESQQALNGQAVEA
jgi:hypothetical protein